MVKKFYWDDTPSAPHVTSTSLNHFTSWPGDQLVVPIGASHISSWLQEIQSREWEERTKNKRTIWAWVNSKCKKCIPLCICRLTLAWISSEIFTYKECQPILTGLPSLLLDSLMPTGHFCCPVSTATRFPHRQLPSFSSFVQFLSRSLTHFRSRRDHGLRPLFGFAPKQTKGSSAWLTTYIVLHYMIHGRDQNRYYGSEWT